MSDPIMIRARELAANSRLWGRHPHNAIMTGQWDAGSIVQGFVQQAEQEVLKNRQEADDE